MKPDRTNPTFNICPLHFQALVVAGGRFIVTTLPYTSSVLTLLPGATNWTSLASLPQPLAGAGASIVGGRMRVNGGYDGGSRRRRSEVMIKHCHRQKYCSFLPILTILRTLPILPILPSLPAFLTVLVVLFYHGHHGIT